MIKHVYLKTTMCDVSSRHVLIIDLTHVRCWVPLSMVEFHYKHANLGGSHVAINVRTCDRLSVWKKFEVWGS